MSENITSVKVPRARKDLSLNTRFIVTIASQFAGVLVASTIAAGVSIYIAKNHAEVVPTDI